MNLDEYSFSGNKKALPKNERALFQIKIFYFFSLLKSITIGVAMNKEE